uniref:FXYD domain-containing ion transport regulator n=1 Tax=Gasterosteus aculeatus aculeatus TaxID=481459 RepID=A0AAQ4QIS3_GASAC
MSKIGALVLMTLVSLGFAEEQNLEEDPFTFDYHRLRVGGLILAACWRPDSSCCPLSHWHHHPVQWPLQVQVQPGQEKEDRKQCSADALRQRCC